MSEIINVDYEEENICQAIVKIEKQTKFPIISGFGSGNSAELFLQNLRKKVFWEVNQQKQFRDLSN